MAMSKRELETKLAYTELENLRLSNKLRRVLLSIDVVKEMNAVCNIDEQKKQAVREFAKKLKEATTSLSGYTALCIIIDELLKEYEK